MLRAQGEGIEPDELIAVPRNNRGTVLITSLNGEEEKTRLDFSYSWVCNGIEASDGGKYVAFSFIEKSGIKEDGSYDGPVHFQVLGPVTHKHVQAFASAPYSRSTHSYYADVSPVFPEAFH